MIFWMRIISQLYADTPAVRIEETEKKWSNAMKLMNLKLVV